MAAGTCSHSQHMQELPQMVNFDQDDTLLTGLKHADTHVNTPHTCLCSAVVYLLL
jgi:hypothetical protein